MTGTTGQRRRQMPRTDPWLRFDDSHPGGHGARSLSAVPAASRCRLAELSLSADVLDARGPRPGLSGPPGTDHRSIRGRRGRRCRRPGSARRLAAAWGKPVIVENHPGAGSTAAPALVAHAPPDGYTLLINTSAQAYSAARAGELQHDPLRDFVPVAALTSQPYVLVAGAQSGITTIDSSPPRPTTGPARSASPPPDGTGTHLAVAKLNRDLGIAAVHTPPPPRTQSPM